MWGGFYIKPRNTFLGILLLFLMCGHFDVTAQRVGDVKNQTNPVMQLNAGSVDPTPNTPFFIERLVIEHFLGGGCIEVENIEVFSTTRSGGIGSDVFNQIATFTGGTNLDVGYSNGIVLSTGNVDNILGPNANPGTGNGEGGTGDPDLNSVFGIGSDDAAYIQFDFRPSSDSISFNFVFASEEYPEWVCSSFKDAFAFLIREQGTTAWENIALIPGTDTPVSINSINSGTPGVSSGSGNCSGPDESLGNSVYYRGDNEAPDSEKHEFDGYTTSLQASRTGLNTCEWYTFKIVIGDAFDDQLDSAVFLEGGSFTDGSTIELIGEGTELGSNDAIEGCRGGAFNFERGPELDISLPYTINFEVTGTATEGVDYETLPRSITFPAGVDQVSLPVFPIADTEPEVVETIILTTTNSDLACGCQAQNFSASIDIFNYQLGVEEITENFCQGESYTLPDGTVVTDTGTYFDTIVNADNCDSLVQYNITFNPTYNLTETLEGCDGDLLTLPDGTIVTTSGLYTIPLLSVDNCDSIVNYNVTIHPTYSFVENADVCTGDGYTYPDGTDQTDQTPGDYTHISMLRSIEGCDSVITTNLTIHPIYEFEVPVETCEGDAYTYPDGSPAPTTPGTYNNTSLLLSSENCDSVINTVLTIHPTYRDSVDVGICDGMPYTLPDGTIVNTTDEYITNLTSINGCDSIIHTFLSVNITYNIEENPEICEGDTYLLPDGTEVSTTGQYIVPLVTARDCDSIITTNLTVNPVYDVNLNPAICDNEMYTLPDGTETNVAGEYNFSFTTLEGGCDSLITVDLEVNPTNETVFSVDLCENETYTLPDGQVIDSDGTYVTTVTNQFDCDSTVTVHITTFNTDTLYVSDSICIEDQWQLPDGTLVGPGEYETNFTYSTSACDSLVIISDIRGFDQVSSDESATTCSNIPYQLPDGRLVDETSIYTSVLVSVDGCDSLVFTDLTVHPSYNTLDTAYICEQDSFIVPSTNEVITQEGLVTEFLETSQGCDSIVNYFVKVLKCTRPGCLDLSTGFSPNGDGVNDTFVPFRPVGCEITDLEFIIIDKWGEIVFRSNSLENAWDGSVDGQQGRVGNYLWYATYRYTDNIVTDSPVEVSGSVVLFQ